MYEMRSVSTVSWAPSELVHCEPIGETSNLAVLLRDRERDEYRLRIVAPDGATLAELGPLVVSHRIRGCGVTFDGSALFWYDDDDLRAIGLDGAWERALRMEGERFVSLFARDRTRVLACRLALFPSVVALDFDSGVRSPMDLPHKPVTQMHPMLDVDSGWRRAAFGYVFDSVEIWNVDEAKPHPWPIDETRIDVLAGSPFIASLHLSRDADRILVSSGPARRGGQQSCVRVGSIEGEDVREFDSSPLSKSLSALPDLSAALSTTWSDSGQILALDLDSGAIREAASVDFLPRRIVITRDGLTCYVVDGHHAMSFAIE